MQFLRHIGLTSSYLGLLLAGAAFAVAGITGCNGVAPVHAAAASGQAAQDPEAAAKLHTWQTEVQPLLQTHCYRCHAGMNRRGGLDMSTRARLMQGGKDGIVVIPGRPEDSLLIKVIGPNLAPDDPMRMPPKGTRLTEAEVATLRKWVADGLVMDK